MQDHLVSLPGREGKYSAFFLKFGIKIGKHCMCIGMFHVKFEPKQTKSVEMRAKSVSQVKLMDFFNDFFKFFDFCQIFRHANLKYQNVVIPKLVNKYQNVITSVNI